jgi:hypothetical protein
VSALNAYAHFAAVFDGTSAVLYVDGIPGSSNGAAGSNAGPRATDFTVGTDTTSYGHFPGDIDEVAIYDKALGAAQVNAHVHLGLGH